MSGNDEAHGLEHFGNVCDGHCAHGGGELLKEGFQEDFRWSVFQLATQLTGKIPDEYVNLLYPLSNLNPLINVWLFLVKHNQMRRGLAAALWLKAMPIKLKDWPDANTKATTVNVTTGK